jgi:hypothetical protein
MADVWFAKACACQGSSTAVAMILDSQVGMVGGAQWRVKETGHYHVANPAYGEPKIYCDTCHQPWTVEKSGVTG